MLGPAVLAALVLAGCGGDRASTAAPEERVANGTPTTAASATPVPSGTVTAGVAGGESTGDAATGGSTNGGDPSLPPEPAETAGSLDAADVPTPPDLGPGWSRYVDPGDAEDGYRGNGSWVRARDAAEVVQAVVPLGCTGLTRAPRLPVPAYALEATYRGPGDAPAVALVLEYGRPVQAAAFVRGLGALGRACPAPAQRVGRGDPLVAVVTQTRADETTVLDRRREYGVGASEWVWSEAVVRRGARVGLLAVAAPVGGSQPPLAGLERAVQASLGGP